jgi:hypothetical protein
MESELSTSVYLFLTWGYDMVDNDDFIGNLPKFYNEGIEKQDYLLACTLHELEDYSEQIV